MVKKKWEWGSLFQDAMRSGGLRRSHRRVPDDSYGTPNQLGLTLDLEDALFGEGHMCSADMRELSFDCFNPIVWFATNLIPQWRGSCGLPMICHGAWFRKRRSQWKMCAVHFQGNDPYAKHLTRYRTINTALSTAPDSSLIQTGPLICWRV